jgi:putative flavoprotein involved in K+ transport
VEQGGFVLATDGETIRSRVVVVATGAYQRPHVPAALDGLDGSGLGIPCVDTLGYRNPRSLPDGAVLVVGSGQSACQIAEELVLSGRDVVMGCGRAPWFPRRPGGRDVFEWLLDTPFFEQTAEQLPSPAARLGANPQASGVAGGHDVHFRTLHALGVRLGGHVSGVGDGAIRLALDLPATLAWSDDAYRMLRGLVLGSCAANGTPPPHLPDPTVFEPRPVETVRAPEIGSVVVAAGFRSSYSEWIDVPGLVDEQGFPRHVDGESVAAPDLHFVGVHFLRRRRSALLFGVGDDAAATATRIADRVGASA